MKFLRKVSAELDFFAIVKYNEYGKDFFDFDFPKELRDVKHMTENLTETEREWETLLQTCTDCTACPLYKTKTNTVFGCGNRKADVMFIGEAPGESEDKQGVPFVGASGQLLDRYFLAVGLPRESVYIANILKCRPPHNRDPLPEEEDACIGHLRAQLKLISPKYIVCLGRVAAKRIIKPDFRITAEHGVWFRKGSYEVCAVYHPSALLRDSSKREDMLRDMRDVAAKARALSQNA